MGKPLLMLAAWWLGLVPLPAQEVALTLNEGPKLSVTPLLSVGKRNQAILHTLRKRFTTAALFVTEGNGANAT